MRISRRAGVLFVVALEVVGIVACTAQFSPVIVDAPQIMQFGPKLAGVGGEQRYLVLALDPAELRPAGGYTGSVGVVGVQNGHLVERDFSDVYAYDLKPGLPFVEPPEALQDHLLGDASLGIADAAWSPDFPTAAQASLQLYELESGDKNIDGVIALTTFAIDRILEVIGPVAVPEYGVTVQPGETTLIGLELTRGVSTQTSNRKAFLDVLAQHIIERLSSLTPLDIPKLQQAFDEISARRDAMVWLKDPAAESWFASSPLGGAVSQQAGDYMYVVEADVEPPSKYSLAVQRADGINVAIDPSGTANDAIEMQWQNATMTPGQPYDALRSFSTNKNGLYGDYVRLLTPLGSTLTSVSGQASDAIDSAEETSTEAGRNVFGNYLLMNPGASTLRYDWSVPGAATLSGGVWDYHLTIQRQPGTSVTPIALTVTLPANATVVSTSGGTVNSSTVSLAANLDADVTFDVRYTLP